MKRWTIRELVLGEHHAHIQSSGWYPGGWGQFQYLASFNPAVETFAVTTPANADYMTRYYTASIRKGIERAWLRYRDDGRLVTSLEIEIPHVDRHPGDDEGRGSSHGSSMFYDLVHKHGVRASAIEPAWLTWNWDTVPALAKLIRAERKFELLPILADALEEAGCTDTELLDHLRTGLPHTDNCWVLDLILGKPA